MYSYRLSKHLRRVLIKLSRKNKKLYEQVLNKINEIINSYSIDHYKNLRHDLKDIKRVQIGPFVLVFSLEKSLNRIDFKDFDHHDKIYKKVF
jgi:mRNA-degrading endonuclease RelE of RelBE toxin-antitoxin system